MQSPFGTPVSELDLARVKRGDKSAQTQLFRQFEKPVYTLCMRMLGHAQNALDALQDSFIRAFGKAADCRGAAFGFWLRAIVVNRCLEELRGHKTQLDRHASLSHGTQHALNQRGAIGDLVEPTLDAQTASSQVARDAPCIWSTEQINHSLDLEHALAKLSDRTRTVVWLYCVEGYQHDEIAALFGQTISFSKSQLSRGLAELRQHLQEQQSLTQQGSAQAVSKLNCTEVRPCPI